jgi:hypothetical protein
MHAYRNTLSRAAAGAWRYAEATGPVTLPILLALAALEVTL